MIKSTDIVKITNRSNGSALYKINDEHIYREFSPKESKMVPFSEITTVAQQPGGRELLYNYFYFENKEVLQQALNIKPEVEYSLTEDKIPAWINSCSLEEFQDALDFATEGVKDLIKKFSVSIPLTDTRKIRALKEQLGFNCEQAIKNERDTLEEEVELGEKQRRVKPVEEEKPNSERRASKYKVVTPKED